MIHYKLKKKDYISPHLEVMWMDDTPICDISGTGPNQEPDGPEPWGPQAKGTGTVTHFGPDFDDEFIEVEETGYEAYKVEW